MNRLKKLLFGAGGAAVTLACLALLSAPPAGATLNGGPEPEDCTYCASYLQACGVWDVYRTCYRVMSGSGTCPPCTPCRKAYRDQ